MGNKGFSLLTVMIALLVSLTGIYGLSFVITGARKSLIVDRDRAIAQVYISELLEAFSSMTSLQFRDYLNTRVSPDYPLCAHVNIMNRNNGTILNPDPNVNLPATVLDGASPTLKANRFYQVQRVDLLTLMPVVGTCDLTPLAFYPAAPNDRLLVTVGVSWVPAGHPVSDVQRVALSTILRRP